ncbi:hypothetical protein [Achromobacter phage Motura]|uniref:Uncharacterized protein n=1 Tax=Achromobacter phage Motura TaxID=2591403 RepID=A0A514CST9_9CAUD|nr:hypothetical protein H1O15_gp247 [Achromobacter phage Motura]QDH83541.1 hypothetical protein [Achromobacter phage Motura]
MLPTRTFKRCAFCGACAMTQISSELANIKQVWVKFKEGDTLVTFIEYIGLDYYTAVPLNSAPTIYVHKSGDQWEAACFDGRDQRAVSSLMDTPEEAFNLLVNEYWK